MGLALISLGLISGCDSVFYDSEQELFDKDVLALVNGQPIKNSDFQAKKESYLNDFPRLRSLKKEDTKKIASSILDAMINNELMLQEAKKQGISVSDDEFLRLLETTSTYPGGDIKKWFDEASVGINFWRGGLRENLKITKLIDQVIYKNIEISTTQAKQYYEDNKNQFNLPETRRVSHIQLRSKDLVKIVIGELKRGGSFRRMVEAYSLAVDRHNQGDLGFLDRKFLPNIFSKPIFAVKKESGITKPIKTLHGHHIFKIDEILPARQLDFDESWPKIKQILQEKKGAILFDKWMNDLKINAKILLNDQPLSLYDSF
ncbi:MAG: SurA N-terminal domain-containing protein [SAR324 cluster bacterium]|nr:SurA N-terminal domain-containing protein [SAR324 cluster bacterium]